MSQEKPNILILGASGGVGNAVFKNLNRDNKYNLTGTFFNHDQPDLLHCDICNPESIRRVVGKSKPDYILNFAGMAQQGLCNNNPEKAHRTNVGGTENTFRLALDNNIPYFYPSSIAVFSAYTDGGKCDEDTPTNPKADSVYGQTKVGAENILSQSSGKHLTIRTDLVLHPDLGFVKLINDYQYAGIKINGGRFPIYLPDLLNSIESFIDQPENPNRLQHLINPDYRLGIKLANLADIVIRKFGLAKETITTPNITYFVPRTDVNAKMPIYIDPNADNNATQRFLFTTKFPSL
ncbi:MAG: dTDP-4-dehydrorhamnose reductase [Candidatus Shapirobacteria bacterium GW2011_GWF1_38_23]|nr:MAG: dTDP-4-dehydrorhamnose reductase [Candidatus Shapirobacteria bacterium GW2011_GWF2_37_20]KKQ64904.1 MAG: dTDP-4-dehydrorhamnose reductase [Candidatus Shapirobacteria bacterium GW2011_GWF1_38_23]HBP51006.1 hypothetical protein [Candidatus Shapirobacteria bacterium]